MKDFMKKSILTGVGLVAMTKDKLEEYGKKVVSELEMSEDEGNSFVEDLKKQSDKAKAELEVKVNGMVGEAINKLGLASAAKVAELEKRIEELEEQIHEDAETE